MLQTQDDKEKRDMTDNYCRPNIPFTLKFDSQQEELTIACKYAHAHAYIKIKNKKKLDFGEKWPGRATGNKDIFWLGLTTTTTFKIFNSAQLCIQ